MRKVSRLSRVVGRGSWIFAAKLLLSLVAIVLAASISVTSTTYQAEFGSIVKFPSGIIATDKGFSASSTAGSSAGANCTSPVQFGLTAVRANTTIVAGHIVFDVQVNATTSAPTNQTFTVTLMVGSTTYGPLCVMTPLVIAVTEVIDCRFDVGNALPPSPYTFKLTIQ